MKSFVAILLPLLAFAVTRAEPPSPYTTTFEDVFVPPPAPNFDSSAPSANYGAPSSGFGTSSGFSSPSANYGAPSSGFGGSSAGFSSPSANYGAPSSGFGSHSSTYGAPSGSSFRGSSVNRYQSPRKSVGQTTAAIFSPSAGYGTPSSTYGAPSGSGYQDDQSEPANYEYAYTVQDSPSGNDFGHREGRQGDSTWGSYFVLLPDGRKQIVEYVADQNGYRPTIRYEDTGRAYGQGGAGGYSY